jgi:hypothetical protein
MLTDACLSNTIHSVVALECNHPFVVNRRGTREDVKWNIMDGITIGILYLRHFKLIAKLRGIS